MKEEECKMMDGWNGDLRGGGGRTRRKMSTGKEKEMIFEGKDADEEG